MPWIKLLPLALLLGATTNLAADTTKLNKRIDRGEILVDWLEANMQTALWTLDEQRIDHLLLAAMRHQFVRFASVVDSQLGFSRAYEREENKLAAKEYFYERKLYANSHYIGHIQVSTRGDNPISFYLQTDAEELDFIANLLAISCAELQWTFNTPDIQRLLAWALKHPLNSQDKIALEGIEIFDEKDNFQFGLKYRDNQIVSYSQRDESILALHTAIAKPLFYNDQAVGRMEIIFRRL